MEFNELDISIKDYIGVLEGGIAVVISMKHEENIYEAIYWYDNQNHKVLTIDMDLEDIIGKIEDYDKYSEIMTYLDTETPDFDDLFGQLSTI